MNMTMEQKAAKDDGICRGYGAQPGTPAYIQCRATQDQRRDAVLLSDSGAPAPVVVNAPPNYGSPPVLQNIIPPTVRCQTMGTQTVCR
jgi:siroheme synthase